MRAALPDFVRRHVPEMIGGQPAWKILDLKLTALPDIHFLSPSITDMNTPSDRRTLDAFIVIALLTVVIAGGNFVSMMTARAAGRAIEVGVRKAVGATRSQIVAQFLSECLFYAGLALPDRGGRRGPGAARIERLPAAADRIRLLAQSIAGTARPGNVAARVGRGQRVSGSRAVDVPARHGAEGHAFTSGRTGPDAQCDGRGAVWRADRLDRVHDHHPPADTFRHRGSAAGSRGPDIRAARACATMAFQDVVRRLPGVRSAACGSEAALGTDLGAAHSRRSLEKAST